MADHTALSFTATLHVDGCPLNTFGSFCTGPIILTNPVDGTGAGFDGTRTIGMLNCSDEDWELGQDSGLVTFGKGSSVEPLLLYFRHFDSGYRLYVRSGKHQGDGVFTTADGLVNVHPIVAKDPCLWKVSDAVTGECFDLTQREDTAHEVQLQSEAGHPLEVHYLYPVGGFLACYPDAHQGSVTLEIQERGVDWLNAD